MNKLLHLPSLFVKVFMTIFSMYESLQSGSNILKPRRPCDLFTQNITQRGLWYRATGKTLVDDAEFRTRQSTRTSRVFGTKVMRLHFDRTNCTKNTRTWRHSFQELHAVFIFHRISYLWICGEAIKRLHPTGYIKHKSDKIYYSDHSGYGLSQRETTLLCNVVSHWLSPYPEWSLIIPRMIPDINCLAGVIRDIIILLYITAAGVAIW